MKKSILIAVFILVGLGFAQIQAVNDEAQKLNDEITITAESNAISSPIVIEGTLNSTFEMKESIVEPPGVSTSTNESTTSESVDRTGQEVATNIVENNAFENTMMTVNYWVDLMLSSNDAMVNSFIYSFTDNKGIQVRKLPNFDLSSSFIFSNTRQNQSLNNTTS